MEFTNAVVDIDHLPAVGAVSLQPVHRSYLTVLRIEWVLTAVVLLAIAAGLLFFFPSLRHNYGGAVIAGSAVLIILTYRISMELGFRFHAYAVREHDLVRQRGWIVRTVKICPNSRIQNCSVQRGPLERRYGLASLVVYTAGTDKADMSIRGLPFEEAERIRHHILQQIHKEEDAKL